MVSKTGSYAQPSNFFESPSNDVSSVQPAVLKNYQNWQVRRQLSCETGFPVFHLIDPWGLPVIAREFIVENIDCSFQEKLLKLSTAEEQQFVCQYLQKRLVQATSYQVHVERHGGTLVVRLGSYGLKGSGNDGSESTKKTETGGTENSEAKKTEETTQKETEGQKTEKDQQQEVKDKTAAMKVSTLVLILGGYLSCAYTNRFTLFSGAFLLNGGLAAGGYAFSCEDKKYTDKEYGKQFFYAGLTGLVSSGFSSLAMASGYTAVVKGYELTKHLWQAIGSFLGNGASACAKRLLADKKAEDEKILTQACLGGVTGAVSSVVGTISSGMMGTDLADKTYIFKKALEGGARAVSSTLATNICQKEDWTDFANELTDTTERVEKDRKDKVKNASEKKLEDHYADLTKGIGISFLFAAAMSGTLALGQKCFRQNNLNAKVEQTEKDLQGMEAERAKATSEKLKLEEALLHSQKELAQQEEALKLLREKQAPKALQVQQAMDEARVMEQAGRQELFEAEQRVAEALQKVEQNQQAVNSLKAVEAQKIQEMNEARQRAQQTQTNYDKKAAAVDKEIRKKLKDGYKAKKAHGNYPKSPEKIKAVLMQGEEIEWKKGPNSVLGSRETVAAGLNLEAQKNQAQHQVQEKTQAFHQLSDSLKQEQLQLQEAQNSLNAHQHQVEHAQAQVEAAQKAQVEYSGQQTSITQDVQTAQHEYNLSVQQTADELAAALKGHQAQTAVCNNLEKSIVIKTNELNVLRGEMQQALHDERRFSMLEGKDRIIRFLRKAYEKPRQPSLEDEKFNESQPKRLSTMDQPQTTQTTSTTNNEKSNEPQPEKLSTTATEQLQFLQNILSILRETPTRECFQKI